MIRTFYLLGMTILAVTAATAGTTGPEEPMPTTELQARINAEYPDLSACYIHLHQTPELSNHEVNTSAYMAAAMRKAGLTVTEHVGGTGVVGILRNGEGPTLLVRTDMDALPVTEATGLEYASRVTATNEEGESVGVMHACGHDVHMTVFLGTARLLSSLRDHWQGTIVFLAQPAEEVGQGARGVIADGLFTRFPRPDCALALHVAPRLPAGTVGYVEGYSFASVDSVDIKVRGVGGHGASPHLTIDPVVIAARIVLALQTIVSRELNPIDPAVVTVGSIHGGTTHNIIPDEVALQLTVRSYAAAVRDHIMASIKRISRGVALSAGVPEDRLPTVTIQDNYTPAVYNDPGLTRRVAATFRATLGADHVRELRPEMVGEDFARYGLQEPRIPILMFRLGTSDPAALAAGQTPAPLHSSHFAPLPEPSIKTGITAMSAAILELMKVKR